MITIEDIIFKLKILSDVIPCIEKDDDISEMINYLEDKQGSLSMMEAD